MGASLVNPQNEKGDPSFSLATTVEQYRGKYVFLAPDDYTISYVDVIHPTGTEIVIDGKVATSRIKQIGSSSYSILRYRLSLGEDGAHVLTASAPIGLQVLGYGSYTSYQYPGGLNLNTIAPPPPPLE